MGVTHSGFRAVHLFPDLGVHLDRRPDGTLLLRSALTPGDCPPTLAAALAAQGPALGERTFLAERGSDGKWARVSYREAAEYAERIAGWFAARARTGPAARPERVLIVTGNSVAHALLTFGAATAGVAVCAVSAQYALSPGAGRGRLRHAVDLLQPTVVFAEHVAPVRVALGQVLSADVTVVCRDPEAWPGAVDWADIVAHPPLADAGAAISAMDPHIPFRYMLTSGSTGPAKMVIHTHKMWCSLFAAGNVVLSKVSGWGVRTLDWMPWSHTAGFSVLIGALINGGTFYIDDGRPAPGLFEATLRNLAEVQPLFFANVPFAFGMLCDALEGDATLREKFFEHLQLCLYGGAGLPQPVYDRFQAMADKTIGERIMFTTGYGATETTAGVMSISWPTTKVGVGLPFPGVEAKLIPLDDERYEVRFRAECVMPGYLDDEAATRAAFDDEGFYRSGDALTFIDPTDPSQGLAFAGRLAEEFKLTTGTFVLGGHLRAELLARLSPVVAEMLVCGEGRDEVGLLVWLNPPGCQSTLGLGRPLGELAGSPAVLDWIAERIRPGGEGHSAAQVRRFAVLVEPPDPDAGEVSDKGSINQATAIRRRHADVERLYRGGPGVTLLP